MDKKKNYRKNYQIRSPEVRITGKDIESEIVNIDEAISIAESKNLDLVEIVPNANPPVCKIVNFKKFLYELNQKNKEMKKSQRKNKTKTKEIRFTYNIGEHDFNFKLNHAKEFLKKNDKVKAVIFFKGREIQFKDQGEIVLLKLIDNLKDFGKPESLPKLEGKKLTVFINPK